MNAKQLKKLQEINDRIETLSKRFENMLRDEEEITGVNFEYAGFMRVTENVAEEIFKLVKASTEEELNKLSDQFEKLTLCTKTTSTNFEEADI